MAWLKYYASEASEGVQVRARTTKDTKVHEGKPGFLCVPSCPLWLTLFPVGKESRQEQL